jgi:hypothetical protein
VWHFPFRLENPDYCQAPENVLKRQAGRSSWNAAAVPVESWAQWNEGYTDDTRVEPTVVNALEM